MHLIISKSLRRQKSRPRSKTMKQKEVDAKDKTAYESAFIHLNTN